MADAPPVPGPGPQPKASTGKAKAAPPSTNAHHHNQNQNQNQHQHPARKISSFQITSVTVGARPQDAGDDSADDLDESHTDDASRVTDLDNETPSFSEDTFSKDDVFYNASSASLGCAPVIPTSAQYGLAIVGDRPEPRAELAPQQQQQQPPKPEMHETVRNERFKVVKIESTEPFRRGRWLCMDYLDHSGQPGEVVPEEINENHEETSHEPAAPSPAQSQAQTQAQAQPQPQPSTVPAMSPPDAPHSHPSAPAPAQQQQQQQQHPLSSHALPAHSHSHPIPAQSYPSHQLQQSLPLHQPMPMHQPMQQIPQQQIQSHIHNAPQIPIQMQPMQSQNQMPPMSAPQSQMQQMQMQQMTNQTNQQSMHQMHQQPQIQTLPQQTHHIQNQQMQNQQQMTNQPPQMQHMAGQNQMHSMQTQQPHQMQPHMQQMQINSQGQSMPSMHGQAQMHQMPSQTGQVNAQQGQVQQTHPIHPQMQQANMPNAQHYNTQPVQQTTNPQSMIQPMTSQTQHLGQQTQVSQPLVQSQHGVPQYYQQTQLTQQGQSLTQEVMAGIVNSQQNGGMPNTLPQGATLPSNLQGMASQQNVNIHSINQPQTIQMMTQATQNIPMSMDNNQSNMQMPVSDPIYMQTSNVNVNQQMPMGQHMNPQQTIINQQVQPSSGQPQAAHIPQQGQMTMPHVMPAQQQVSNQSGVVNQAGIANMQNVPIPQNQPIPQQLPQVSLPNVVAQPIMQNMVGSNQNVVSHGQSMTMPMQQNIAPPMQQNTSVHNVPTSVVQTQTNIHGQINMPMGAFNSQGVVGSMQQNALPAMSQTNMTAPMGIQNPVNNQMDVHISQQNICSSTAAVSQPVMSGTNSPVVSLPVSSTINYVPNPGAANTIENQNFGSPVSAVVPHVVNSSQVNNNAVLPTSDVSNESGGGTPVPDGAQADSGESKDDMQTGQNSEDSESASGTSAVAIDNKIEQAMDLVKSHLMFAVREEVEVLKEKIAELMERINQLEVENSFLRSQASPETLAQLAAQTNNTSPPSGPVS